MKITCISASRVPSSTANSIQVMKVCQALAQLGHAVTLLAPGPGGSSWEEMAAHYGLVTPFQVEWVPAHPSLRRYDFCWSAVQKAQTAGADVLYVWPLQAAVFGLLKGFPLLLELHGEPEGMFGPLLYRLFLTLPGKKRFLPITQALADYLERAYHRLFVPGELVIAPNGIDLDRFCDLPEPADARRALGFEDRLSAGYTGHLYPGRGMGLLVELAKRYPAVQFLWVGGRPEDVGAWRGRLAAEKIDNVIMTGFVENRRLPLYQAAAEILLMPYEKRIAGSSGGNSADYCSPMKMFEYMGCGRAIISSDLPVIHEVLNDENAILCPPEQVDRWAQALGALLADPIRREDLGRRARQDVEAYSWQKRAEKALAGFYGG